MKTSTPTMRQKSSGSATPPGRPQLLSPGIFIIATIALLATVAAIYSPALDYQFILDDHHYVGDPRLQSSGHVWEYFTTFVWAQFTGGPACFYRPLFLLWMRLNFILCGVSAGGWHLLSIAKHLAAVACLGVLVWKLLRDRAAVLLAMALFALHPSHTESVAWVSVPDPLMAAAILVSLLLYFKYADSVPSIGKASGKASRKGRKMDHPKPWRWLVASAIGCFAALLAKETGVVLPIVILALTLVMPIGDNSGPPTLKSRLLGSIRVGLLFLAATTIYLLIRWRALGEVVVPTQDLPLRTVLLSSPATLWFYVKALLWPVRSRAFADSIATDTFSVREVLFPALALC
jgi:hypothetical protein